METRACRRECYLARDNVQLSTDNSCYALFEPKSDGGRWGMRHILFRQRAHSHRPHGRVRTRPSRRSQAATPHHPATLTLTFASFPGPQAERLLTHLRSAQRALLDAHLGGEGRIHLAAHSGGGGGGCADRSGLRCGASIGSDTSGACASAFPYTRTQQGNHPCAASAHANCARSCCGTTGGTAHCSSADCGGCSCRYDTRSVSPRSPLRGDGRGGASNEALFGSPEGSDREEAMAKQREALLQNAFGGARWSAAGDVAVIDNGACKDRAFTGAGRMPNFSCEGHGDGDSTDMRNRHSSCSTARADTSFAAPASPRRMSTLEAMRAAASAPWPQSEASTCPVTQPMANAAAVGHARTAHGASNAEHGIPSVPSVTAGGAERPCSPRGSATSCPGSARASPIYRPGSAPPTQVPTRSSMGARRRLSCGCNSHGCAAAAACEVVPLARSASSSVIRAPDYRFGVRAPGAAAGNASHAALSHTAHSRRGSPLPQMRPAKGPLSHFGGAPAGGSYGGSCFDDDSPYVTMAYAAWAAGGRRQDTEHRRSSTPATVWNRAWR
jgi:hypothetical protein